MDKFCLPFWFLRIPTYYINYALCNGIIRIIEKRLFQQKTGGLKHLKCKNTKPIKKIWSKPGIFPFLGFAAVRRWILQDFAFKNGFLHGILRKSAHKGICSLLLRKTQVWNNLPIFFWCRGLKKALWINSVSIIIWNRPDPP